MEFSGKARSEATVHDFSAIVSGKIKGVSAVCGETERGEFNKPVVCRNWKDFTDNFGGLSEEWNTPNTDIIFPYLCQRVFNGGGSLLVSRIEHYTDITDVNTGTSTKGSVTVGSIPFESQQYGDFACNVTLRPAISGKANKYDILVSLIGYNLDKLYVDVDEVITVAFAKTLSKKLKHVTVSAGTINLTVSVLPYGDFTNSSSTPFATFTWSSGVLTLDANNVVSECITDTGFAITKGKQYKIKYTKDAGDEQGYYIKLSQGGTALSMTKKLENGVILTATSDGTASLVSISTDVNGGALTISSITIEEIASKTMQLSGGTYDYANITDTDYVGDLQAGTGIHAFDDSTEHVRIAVMQKASPIIDKALADYVVNITKGTVRAILRTPIGVTGYGAIDYRNGEGIYTHQPIDTHLCSMTVGGLNVTHPSTEEEIDITEIADYLAVKSVRDKTQAWFVSAGHKYPIQDNNGVVYNLGSTARIDEANAVDRAGLNMVIKHRKFGVVPWGNGTLQREKTLLMHENVSEMLVAVVRGIYDIVDLDLFDVNDLETWRAIWRKVIPYLDFVKDNRGIWDYVYMGDQYADTLDDLVINNPDDLDSGGYIFRIWLQPKVGLKYIGIEINIVGSSVDMKILKEQSQPS